MTDSLRNDLQELLADVAIVRRIYCFDEIGSTSDWAREFVTANGSAGDLDGTLVVARHQTTGRGRFGRKWQSAPDKSLLMSLVLEDSPGFPMLLPAATCVAVCRTVRNCGCAGATIKYPNDIMMAGRKMAGILIESVSAAVRRFHIVGIGINANLERGELPRDTRMPATSLLVETGKTTALAELAHGVVSDLQRCLAGGSIATTRELNRLCDTIGKVVQVSWEQATVTGTALALDDEGALLLRTESGETVRVTSGDVVQVT